MRVRVRVRGRWEGARVWWMRGRRYEEARV